MGIINSQEVSGALCCRSRPVGASRNEAFVFIKPHAQTKAVRDLVQQKFQENKITITDQGEIKSDVIDNKKLIDKHYYAIASKATLLSPDQLPVPADKFRSKFGEEWVDVLAAGKAANAMQACEIFGLDAVALEAEWEKAAANELKVKLGGGFYCAKLTVGDITRYVFNAFFMSLRSKFTNPNASIHWYTVQWNAADCTWLDFRKSVLGPTDPAAAPVGSLRRSIYDSWQTLGLREAPNTGDNGIHASASPFEAAAERMNWLQRPVGADRFAAAMLLAGLEQKRIEDWILDPQVRLLDCSEGSIFDALEDLDTDACVAKIVELNTANGPRRSISLSP